MASKVHSRSGGRVTHDGIDVSVVIVNWHSRDFLTRCIESIRMHTRLVRYEIVVIDSGSFDGCGEMLCERYPEVRFVQSASNLGFAQANNRAFQETIGASVLFLNPDTELVNPALDVMHDTLQSLHDAGIVGCRLLNADGSVQTSCIQSIPTIANQLLDSEFLRSRWPRSSLWGMAALALASPRPEPVPVEAISGACLMIARTTFEAVGRFSEDYFMYAEDMDLCHKVSRSGWVNYYVPAATVTHFGGASSEQSPSTFSAVMLPEAIWRFLRKTRGGRYAAGYRLAMLVSAVGRLFLLGAARLARPHVVASRHAASRRRWLAVLRWSLRCEPVVKRYYSARRPSYVR
jgi:N-acetylglucosaminyl-diphospho-decaprenol L-rhamnosyltransferase